MTKHAVILSAFATNDIIDDMQWAVPDVYVIYDLDQERFVFITMELSVAKGWLDIRNYTEKQTAEVFTCENGDWEMRE